MAEESMTMRDLGFDFGPDPFGDKAAVAKISAFVHKPEFWYFVGILAACAAYWVWVLFKKAGERRDSVVIAQGREVQQVQRREAAFKELQSRDPAFGELTFLKRAGAMFLKVQSAWSEHQLPMARAFISDGLYERLRDELDRQGVDGVRDRLSETRIVESRVLGYAVGFHYDSIAVGFKVSSVRERFSLATQAKLDGGDAVYEEVWTFVRRPSAATLAKPGAVDGLCPSCGAPLTVTDAARCEACKAWINSGEYDWIAVESIAPWEWRFPDPRREITGWSDLREDDPALSLETLEDRASVVFWRWIEALRSQDPAPLRGLAAPEFVKGLSYEEHVAAEPLLGAVELIAFEPGVEYDQVHIQARWENGRERRTDYLIFRRRSGQTTKWQAGFSATRCAACGAPSDNADATICAYCSEPVGWVLAALVPFGEWKRPAEAAATLVMPGCDWGDSVPAAHALAALAACVVVDGSIHDRERAYMNAYAERRGVPPEKVDDLIEQARAGTLAYDPLGDTAFAELRGLIRMSLADGFIEDSERDLLARVARAAGVHDLELKQMIKEERLALAARARELVGRIG